MITTEPNFELPQLNNHAITADDIRTYTRGHFDSFAIALHLLFKYPIYAIMQVFPDDENNPFGKQNPLEERADSVHYVVKRKDFFLDVEGEHADYELIEKYRSRNHVSTGTRFDLVSIKDVIDSHGHPELLAEATLLILRDQAFYE